MEEHRDAYESENPFFVPKGARWKYYIKSQAKQTTIGIKIVRNEDELMIYIYMILLSLVIVFEAKITNHSVKSSSMIERLDIILILSMIIQVFFTIYIFVITING